MRVLAKLKNKLLKNFGKKNFINLRNVIKTWVTSKGYSEQILGMF